MEDEKKTRLFETVSIPKAVMTLSVPTMISALVMVIYNLADTYFVGMLNDSVQNSAVTLAAPVLLAFNAVNNLFGVGSSSMMSRGLGRKDYDTVYRSSAFGFYCALFCGVLFGAFCTIFKTPLLNVLGADEITAAATGGYLKWTVSCGAVPAILNVVIAYLVRAEGSSLHASIGTMSGCLLNIILDPIFILPWGLNMGASGAGFATFISNCAACLYFFVLLFVKRGHTYVCISPKMFGFRKNIVTGVFGVGIPASIQNLLNVTGMTLLNNLTAAYNTSAVAAMGVAYKLHNIPFQIALGLSQGIMPLISYNYAANNPDRLKKTLFFTMKIALAFLTALTVLYIVFSRSFIAIFMPDPTVIDYGSKFLIGLSLALPFLCVDFIAVGVFQACGLGSKSLLFAVLRKIVLEIPFILLLDRLFPLYGLAWSQFCAELILSRASVFALARILRRIEREQPQKL